MPKERKEKAKVEPEEALNPIQAKVLWFLKHYGTHTQGEDFHLRQVVRAIDQFYLEVDEGNVILASRGFRFVKVVPN